MTTSDDFPVLLKDPGSHEDFVVDWAAYLDPSTDTLDSIISVTIDPAVTGGVELLAPPVGTVTSISGKKSVCWLTGGVEGRQYVVTHRVLTTQGRTAEASFRLKVRNL